MPNLPANAKLWILQITSGEYEDTHTDNIAIVTDETLAQTWLKLGMLEPRSGNSFEVELINLNVMDKHWREKLDLFRDPARNPQCECGHSLIEHSKRNQKKCGWNRPKTHPDAHDCPGFRLAPASK